MENLKKNWLKAIMGLTLALSVGYFAVNASEKKPDKVEKKVSAEANAFAPVYKWYALIPTSNTSTSAQQLLTGSPMSSPPSQTNPLDCARENNAGDFCAVIVEFAPGTTNFTLSGTDLQDAINNHTDAVGIASSNPDVDEDQDGYSRKPEL
ncbi:hypothetical protein SAMN05660841_03213 [Sphingobacterium nematocida]|uniref:DUF4189 domain-containing protein n=1 Tax=Sphingobacterium nematocida TaxID=1513896 RepID=A0A1T5FFZ9_9SPHI|nr:hypothetical protein [Sphingobacterium nematocida]SKB95089.1 hypothetical protein SAMN05660841_03213 [Sphingobacterium nematocida]